MQSRSFWISQDVDEFDDLRSLPPHILHPEYGKARAPLKDRIHLYSSVKSEKSSLCSFSHNVLVRKRNGLSRIVEEEFVSLFRQNGERIFPVPVERYGLVD